MTRLFATNRQSNTILTNEQLLEQFMR